MMLQAITPREASIFAAAADALLAPDPGLPPVRETGTVTAFDQWLLHAPRLNRAGVRAALYFLELAPLAGHRRRFRRLDRERRLAFLMPPARERSAWGASLVNLLQMLVAATYYADDDVARLLGYDPEARVARGRDLRSSENRP